jgi:SAM-dependent methyltransferase
MVYALQEAHRVLRPDGLLVDLRPAPAHRRVGIQRGRHWTLIGKTKEDLTDDHAANQAVRTAVGRGLFRRELYDRFELKRHVGGLSALRRWLEEFAVLAGLPSHAWLVDRVAAALAKGSTKATVVVRGPLELRVLRKRG